MYVLITLDLPKLTSLTIINAALYGNPENKEEAGESIKFYRNEITIESIYPFSYISFLLLYN